ncbi:MAG TPA: hypothetical protein VMF61_08565, partial [Candidatus Acidoferrales bacterium]|nr:hypothetical protein [Candidatus Acidoferrales bacterium]
MTNVGKRTCVFALLAIAAACNGQHGGALLPTSTAARHAHVRPQDAASNYEAVVLGDNPTGYYRLDDTGAVAADSSGN